MPEVVFNGAAGRLEGRYHQANFENAPIALILHPHPQFRGTMNNNVVYALYRCFINQGFTTLRFNFRGVGRSEGSYGNGEGELSDAAAALDWLQSIHPNAAACWVGGFSFGAWIGMQLLMRRPELDGFVSASPPADRYDFNFLAPCPVSGLIVQGNMDQEVSHHTVGKLVDKLRNQRGIHIDYQLIEGSDHFFTNKRSELCLHVEEYITRRQGASLRLMAG